MSKKKYNDDIKVINKHKFVWFKTIVLIILSVGFVVGTYFLSILLSNPLNVSGSLIYNYKNAENFSYYALKFGEYSNIDEAIKNANIITKFNGAGYILFENNKYNLLGAIYLNENDAKNVIKNNGSYNYSNNIYEISLNEINIDLNKKFFSKFGNFNNVIKENCEIIKNTIEELEKLSFLYDSKDASSIHIASKITNLNSNISLSISKLKMLFIENKLDSLNSFINSLVKIEKCLNNLTNSLLIKDNCSSNLKHTIIDIVVLFRDISK